MLSSFSFREILSLFSINVRSLIMLALFFNLFLFIKVGSNKEKNVFLKVKQENADRDELTVRSVS